MCENFASIEAIYDLFIKYPLISTDSRNISTGSIFFALKGPSFDGNRYAAGALESGAVAVVVDDPAVVAECGAERTFLVKDVLTALQELACHHRRKLGIPVLAITGSNGKTTTKELVSRVLARKFNVSTTSGNLNNHIGVPLTLLGMGAETEFGVVEMGASACGEIARLCEIARPDYGIITNVGHAHLEGFGGFEGVKRGKGELLDYLAVNGGEAFYAADNDDIAEMVTSHEDIVSNSYMADLANGFRSALVGDYNKLNIAAAVAIGRYFNISDNDIASAIASYNPDNNRSQAIETECNSLILDCYNANPSSMRAALENFSAMTRPVKNGIKSEKCAILGDMKELGEWTDEEHLSILESVRSLQLEKVFLVGEYFTKAAAGDYISFPDSRSLLQYLHDNPLRNKFILIKGSRGMKLENLLPEL